MSNLSRSSEFLIGWLMSAAGNLSSTLKNLTCFLINPWLIWLHKVNGKGQGLYTFINGYSKFLHGSYVLKNPSKVLIFELFHLKVPKCHKLLENAKKVKKKCDYSKYIFNFLISSSLSVTSFKHFQRVIRSLKVWKKGSLKIMKKS